MNEADEDDIVPMALKGLAAANTSVIGHGFPIVFVENGKLIRVENGKRVILRELPSRPKATELMKQTEP